LASQIKAARRNLFSESKILHWFVQLALGLHYMHNNKVLHRDLKTQNVFLLGNGRLVLGDLGISKVLDGTMDFAQTCIGTPYCEPSLHFPRLELSLIVVLWSILHVFTLL
jgi:NIMA (never in mitosis gene a)-related kinase 1/4/5